MTRVRPMKPCIYQDWKPKFPVYGQPKLDGIRTIITGNYEPQSANGKILPNINLQNFLKQFPIARELDGELIVGRPTNKNAYRRTVSMVMSHHAKIRELRYYIFDSVYPQTWAFRNRYGIARGIVNKLNKYFDTCFFTMIDNTLLQNMDEVEEYYKKCLDAGYEGIILRGPNAEYKQGRTTINESGLVKYKPFKSDEAVVINYEPWYKNDNPATKNELGFTQHSSHKSGKKPLEALGALVCLWKGHTLKIGTGFTHAQRVFLWKKRKDLLDKIVEFKYLNYGIKDKPRHPVFLRFRSPRDLTKD